MIVRVISFLIVMFVKWSSRLLYRTQVHWITPKDQLHWEEARIFAVLNHTSLFEPLFISAFSNYRLWRATRRVIVPIADVTMKRPLTGIFFKALVPGAIPITRKRDETWDYFMKRAQQDTLTVIFPEGRMKRKDGLDKHGNPMSVKGGIADILDGLNSGYMIIGYSGGLHHVQAPGEKIPRIFKTIKIAIEEIEISSYKSKILADSKLDFRSAVIQDLESRMKKYCP